VINPTATHWIDCKRRDGLGFGMFTPARCLVDPGVKRAGEPQMPRYAAFRSVLIH
jgi:hypothetical protein